MTALPTRLAKSQYELLAALRYALRRFQRFSEEAARDAGLTPQQHQTLLAIKGFPDRDYVSIGEIAARLHLSAGTVRNYLTAAVTKLNARNRTDAARIAREAGWL